MARNDLEVANPGTAPLSRRHWLLAPALLLLLVLPLAHTVALRLVCLGASFLLALPVIIREGRSLPCAAPLALWSSICLASAAWSVRPGYSLGEFKTEVIYPLLTFFTFYATIRTEIQWRAAVAALVAGFLFFAALASRYLWSPIRWDLDNPGFLLVDVNQASFYMVLVAPVFAAAALRSACHARRLRTLVGAGGALLLGVALLTHNRTLWLALLVQAALFTVLYLWREQPARATTFRAIAAVAVVCAAMLFLFMLSSYGKSGEVPVDAEGIWANLDQSVRPRIWILAIEKVAERPWLGHGFGREIVSEHLLQADPRFATHSHNHLLNILLEVGLVGLAAALAVLACLAKRFGASLSCEDRATRLAGITGLCLLAGVLVKGVTDVSLFRGGGLLFWAVAGLLLGVIHGARTPTRLR